jgi:hypothetical protein
MQTNTITVLESLLKTDNTVSPVERRMILKMARGESAPALTQNGSGHAPRIFSRTEAAKILGDRTTRFIDKLCARGLLKKFTPPGNQRAIGISGESLHSFISGT